MPADQLTEPTPEQLARGTLAVLAGASLDTAATEHGLNLAELVEAVETYQAGGYAALERRIEQRWTQVLVEFPSWEDAESIATTQLGPRLDTLHSQGVTSGWWFLRKHPHWRLRLRHPGSTDGPAADAIAETLTELTSRRALTGWRRTIYEPEYAAFGGAIPIEAVHDLFRADSQGVLDYLQRPVHHVGRREISIMLISTLLHAARLDEFEHGDVYHRIAQLRPTPTVPTPPGTLSAIADDVRKLSHVAVHTDDPMFSPIGPAAFAAQWRNAFQTAGQRLHAAAVDGSLGRGLRAVLTHIVIFHWNRLGLSAHTQGALARAAEGAYLPPA